MELMISLDELSTYKSKDLCPIKCQQCKDIFYAQKNYVKAALKDNSKVRLKFCSRNCRNKSFDKKTIIACAECEKEVLKERKEISENNFCSKSCSAKHSNKRNPRRKLEGKCATCNSTISKVNKYCKSCYDNSGAKFKEMKLSDMAEYYSGSSRQKFSYGWRANIIREQCRRWNKHLIGASCESCGYDKHTEFCHITAIRDFPEESTLGEINDLSNIIMLCPNCHWEFDNGLLDIKKSGYFSRSD